jgi:cobalt transporter subunit CbtB
MIRSPTSLDASPSGALVRAWRSAVLALVGVVILLGVGFADLPQVHDAAHDTRHSFNFPCH